MLSTKLAQANGRLKAANIRVRIEPVGDRLTLRATLPPRPDSDRAQAFRQRIYLHCNLTAAGLKFAEAEAKKIGAALDMNQFNWMPYLKLQVDESSSITCGEIVQNFKVHKFRQGISASTWTKDYEEVFKRLPASGEFTEAIAIALVSTQSPNTKSRKRYCLALGAIASFAGMNFNLKQYQGSYSPTSVEPRDIPSDLLIQGSFNLIPNEQWGWAYGLLATYGLRPGELSSLEFDLMPVLIVKGGKNQSSDRRVWPIYPEWVDRFDLSVPKPPLVADFGEQCSKQFGRYDLDFSPYDLRHAWAIRSMEFGLPIELAASQMGHSLQIHSRVYHRWISDRHHQRAYDVLINRPDRPHAPVVDSL